MKRLNEQYLLTRNVIEMLKKISSAEQLKIKNIAKRSDRISFIEYHADDYGLFPAQSRRILDCGKGQGVLNAVSVMANSERLSETMNILAEESLQILVAVHLNFIEGHCVAPMEDVPLLINKEGIFKLPFGKLLVASCSLRKAEWRTQLKREISAQISAMKPYLNDTPLRLDGHMHYHMLPIVFDALMDVIKEEELTVSYIRFPREYPWLYVKRLSKLQGWKPINLLKCAVLNCLVARNQRKYANFVRQLEHRLFLGVCLSGNYSYENTSVVLPDAIALARKLGISIELLAHPGGVYEEEDIKRLTYTGDVAFLTSNNRKAESKMFRHINKIAEEQNELGIGKLEPR